MAIDYTTQGAIRGDSTFKTRLDQSLNKAALDISGEDQNASTTEEWAARQALAHQVLRGTNAVGYFSQPVLANIGAGASSASTESEITDAELDTAVAAVWNDVAGIAAT